MARITIIVGDIQVSCDSPVDAAQMIRVLQGRSASALPTTPPRSSRPKGNGKLTEDTLKLLRAIHAHPNGIGTVHLAKVIGAHVKGMGGTRKKAVRNLAENGFDPENVFVVDQTGQGKKVWQSRPDLARAIGKEGSD